MFIVNVGLCHLICLGMARGIIFMKIFAFSVKKEDSSRSRARRYVLMLGSVVNRSIMGLFCRYYWALCEVDSFFWEPLTSKPILSMSF